MSAGRMSAAAAHLLPWLLVLPALLFATPLSPIADDPYPHLAGMGWAALALVPLALLVLARGASPAGAWPFVLTLLWALAARALAPVTDTFEARRAVLVLALIPLAFAGGAALDERGRARFQFLLVLLTLAWTGFALWSGWRDGNFAGVLGDTGSLSQAALPGAALGAAWLARERGGKRALGSLALAAFLAHVAAAPVLAGSHTLLAGLLLGAWFGRGRGRAALALLALAALLAPFVGMAARELATGAAPESVEGAPASPSHSLNGLGVRGLVWNAALGLVADHPLFGAGPGQFQAAFPPYRDPREIELSRHGSCSELDTEVEHAHNDWLQAFCELGLPGGILFALGLGLAARAALARLADEQDIGLAVAALALLVNAFVHAPLFANPASSVLAFALFGAASVRANTRRPRRLAGTVLAFPALAAVLLGPALVRHGQALCAFVEASRGIQDAGPGANRADLEPRLRARQAAIAAANATAPDSAPARLLAAREARATPELWERVLAVRPHAVEAWEQSGTFCATTGLSAEAHARYQRALALSPTHPRILRNSARLECSQGDIELGLDAIERLRLRGCLAPGWTQALGSELVLELGAPARGARLLFGRELATLVPEELHARHRNGAAKVEDEAEASECLAQLLWARAHAAHGDFGRALRSYRQAAERSWARRGAQAAPASLYSLELAAAELRAGHGEAARARARELAPDSTTLAELPDWARELLPELGLAPSAGPR